MKFAAGKPDAVAVELAAGVVEFQLAPEDEGLGIDGVVKVVSSLIPAVVALPVILSVTGLNVPVDGRVGGVSEGVRVSLRVAVPVAIVPLPDEKPPGVDKVGQAVSLPAGVIVVAFVPETVGFDVDVTVVAFHPSHVVDNGGGDAKVGMSEVL